MSGGKTKGENSPFCPQCAGRKVYVTDSRTRASGAVYRRRACRACGHRFSTFEVNAAQFSALIQRLQSFERTASIMQDMARSVRAELQTTDVMKAMKSHIDG